MLEIEIIRNVFCKEIECLANDLKLDSYVPTIFFLDVPEQMYALLQLRRNLAITATMLHILP